MNRKTLLSIGAVVALLAIVGGVWLAQRAPAKPKQPNVLLITIDTTRADHLSCYGYPRKTSPRIDELAADGVRFDCAISTSAITPISHASIMTGTNPDIHGLRVFYGMAGNTLRAGQPTLAGILRDAGWKTGAFVSSFTASEQFGLNAGFDTFQSQVAEAVFHGDPSQRPPKDGYWQQKRVASAQRRADATTDEALAWLKQIEAPFFMWVHYFDPHDPSLVPPQELLTRWGAQPDSPLAALQVYDPEIYFMDEQIGRVLDHLRQTGEYDKTIIVVVADHGQGLGDHNWFPHRLLYQEQIRLPLIVRLPNGPHGRVVDELVRSIDIMPTVLEELDQTPPAVVEGENLRPLMDGAADEPRIGYAEALNTIDMHTPPQMAEDRKDLLFCAMDRRWKLIHHFEKPENSELYDLRSDPRELRNVISEYPDERARLFGWLEQAGVMKIEFVRPEGAQDDEARRKLESLGYIGEGGG